MEFTIEKEVTYVPDVYDNKLLPEDEQVVVTIRVPTASETSSITNATSGGANSSDIVAGVSRFVKKIINLKVNGMEITTGREMASAVGMYIFALNIGSHILGMLTDIEKDPT